MAEIDDEFFDRADQHINLSNAQMKQENSGKVSASMMYGLSRFNSWVSACGWENGDDMKKAKQETLDYFVSEYKIMLEENLDDYINNFDKYMKKEN